MICDGYVGELSDERKMNWNCKNNDPYTVLKKRNPMIRGAHSLLSVGDKYFRERIQVDWGSFAWKCNKEELERFMKENDVTFKKQPELDDRKEYGILFIDSGFSGEDLYD